MSHKYELKDQIYIPLGISKILSQIIKSIQCEYHLVSISFFLYLLVIIDGNIVEEKLVYFKNYHFCQNCLKYQPTTHFK